MKKGLTEIVFTLDRSGSMAGLEDDTIGGFDAVSRLICWQGDERRGVNGSTMAFLKKMDQGLHALHSTAYPGVTKAVEEGVLGTPSPASSSGQTGITSFPSKNAATFSS